MSKIKVYENCIESEDVIILFSSIFMFYKSNKKNYTINFKNSLHEGAYMITYEKKQERDEDYELLKQAFCKQKKE